MQIADYIAGITGKTYAELFALGDPLVGLEQGEDGKIIITHWAESLSVAQPSDADILEALDAPEPVTVPTSVSSRQFKLQLLAEDLLDQVDTWVAAQSRAVQIAYEYSGSFVRSDGTMALGFAALNFTDAQIDAFYVAASKL